MVVFQQTPLTATVVPPSEVIVPPLCAEVKVIVVTPEVDKVGIVTDAGCVVKEISFSTKMG